MLGLADNALNSFSIPSMSLRSTPYFCENGIPYALFTIAKCQSLR